MTELQIIIALAFGVALISNVITGCVVRDIVHKSGNERVAEAVRAQEARMPGSVELIIQEHPKGKWHYRAFRFGEQVVPRKAGGHTSSTVARQRAQSILNVKSIKVMNYSAVQRTRSEAAKRKRRERKNA